MRYDGIGSSIGGCIHWFIDRHLKMTQTHPCFFPMGSPVRWPWYLCSKCVIWLKRTSTVWQIGGYMFITGGTLTGLCTLFICASFLGGLVFEAFCLGSSFFSRFLFFSLLLVCHKLEMNEPYIKKEDWLSPETLHSSLLCCPFPFSQGYVYFLLSHQIYTGLGSSVGSALVCSTQGCEFGPRPRTPTMLRR